MFAEKNQNTNSALSGAEILALEVPCRTRTPPGFSLLSTVAEARMPEPPWGKMKASSDRYEPNAPHS
jgi:hypothetical protein